MEENKLNKAAAEAASAETAPDILKESEAKWREDLKRLVIRLMETAEAKKAEDILAARVSDKTIIADWFIFMSGASVIHVKTLCDEIEDKAAELGLAVKRKEGYREGRWIVIDFASILVHIFHPEEREYYNVERLWIDPATEVLRP